MQQKAPPMEHPECTGTKRMTLLLFAALYSNLWHWRSQKNEATVTGGWFTDVRTGMPHSDPWIEGLTAHLQIYLPLALLECYFFFFFIKLHSTTLKYQLSALRKQNCGTGCPIVPPLSLWNVLCNGDLKKRILSPDSFISDPYENCYALPCGHLGLSGTKDFHEQSVVELIHSH